MQKQYKKQLQYFSPLIENYRKINSKGQVVDYDRYFHLNLACAISRLQHLLSECQSTWLHIHYANINKQSYQFSHSFQTITYRTTLVGNCQGSFIQKIGNLYIQYQIISLDKNKIKCQFPYLLLFHVTIELFYCEQCDDWFNSRIYRSQYQVIRNEFVRLLSNKIFFMNKYPNYQLFPHSFENKRESGYTKILRLRCQNIKKTQYYQIAQKISVNKLRMYCIENDLDFEAICLDNYCQRNKFSQKSRQNLQKLFTVKEMTLNIKYICCNSKPRVQCKIQIFNNQTYPSFPQTSKTIVDENPQFLQFAKNNLECDYRTLKLVDIDAMSDMFDFKQEALDRSTLKREEIYKLYSTQFNQFGSWHRSLQNYRYPFLVIISIKIPPQKCNECQKMKHGLIQMHQLIEQLDNGISDQIGKQIKHLASRYFARQ